MITGRSNPISPLAASTASVPRPGRKNTASTKTTLPNMRPRSMPSMVTIGIIEFLDDV